MPLQKLAFAPGVNREQTSYSSEGMWFDCDKVRFRSGQPEKIGGWQNINASVAINILGTCRALHNWGTLTGFNLVGAGTHLKYYLELGSTYYDITPLRITVPIGAASLDTVSGSVIVTVNHTGHGAITGDFVTFSNARAFNGLTLFNLDAERQITVTGPNTYTVEMGPASSTGSGGGAVVTLGTDPLASVNTSNTVTVTHTAHGATDGAYITISGATAFNGLTTGQLNAQFQIFNVTLNTYDITVTGAAATGTGTGGGAAVIVAYEITAAYQISIGAEVASPLSGWGTGSYGSGTWGVGLPSTVLMRIWNHDNFGEDLIYGPRGGPLYYWDATGFIVTPPAARGVALSSLGGASDVPNFQNKMLVSDISRFVLCFGTNTISAPNVLDPMLIRWSDQESAVNWTPSITNQAGSIRLSNGTAIISAISTRQEILVWTDSSLYSMQYIGPPYVWRLDTLSDNISIISPNAAITTNNVTFWMGLDKFYVYTGRVETLPCTVRQYVFGDFNLGQAEQVFAGTNERFSEIWWFYCSADSSDIDRYVVFNYLDKVWTYGTLSRTAWLDAPLRVYPLAAAKIGAQGINVASALINHELGTDDGALGSFIYPITAYIESADFDIGDGHNYGFVWRMIPDVTFAGSSSASPAVQFTLKPRTFSGTNYLTEPPQTVTQSATVPVEQYTGQVYVRVRGRQMALRVSSSELGVSWQLGRPRIDIRPDGRRA